MHSRKPLRIAVDTELWCTLHVWSAICERFNPSLCRCGAFECRPLAQIAICGMRQLNCGSSSRFRIRLAQMWVKTNRTKTAPMDISNIGCWLTFWHSFWHSDRLDPSSLNPISLRVSRVSLPLGICFFRLASLRSGAARVRTGDPSIGGWRRRATCRVDGSEERTCVYLCCFLSFHVCKHIVLYFIIEGSLEVKLPIIWTDEKQSREEAERRERLEERRVEEKE